MSKKKFIPIIVIVFVVSSYFFITSATLEFNEFTNYKNTPGQGPALNKNTPKRNIKIAKYNEIQEAINNEDYEKWKELISKNPTPINNKILLIINNDNFSEYVKYVKLNKSGNYTEASIIKRKLGLNFK